MKKTNDKTWLSFFKKTLKVFTLLLLVVVIIFVYIIYSEKDNDGKTYLNCEEKFFLAFDTRSVYSTWDGLEKKWKVNLDITKINKKVIEAEFEFQDGKGIYIIDRVKGTIELKNLTKMESLVTRKNCKKIKKSDLPKSKISPKF